MPSTAVPASSKDLGPGFRPLAVANLAAQTAEQLALAATPLLAVLLLGARPAEVGLIAAAQTLPFLLLALPMGVLADRHRRQRVLLACEGLRVAALVALLGLLASGQVSVVALALLGALGAVGTVGFSVAAPALVPALVAREALPLANARLELARGLAFTAGPALGGVLVGALGGGAVFGIATALSALAVLALLRLRAPEPAVLRAPGPGVPLRELADAAAFVWRHPQLRPVLWTALGWNLAWFVLHAALVPHAVRSLGLTAQGVGAVLAVYGVGALAGALLAPRVVHALGFALALRIGPWLSLVAATAMAGTLLWPTPWLAALAMGLFGFGPTIWVVTSTTLRQAVTPPALLARVGAVFLTVNAGARPLGAGLAAALAAWLSMQGRPPAWAEAACLLLALLGFAVQAVTILGCVPDQPRRA
jgi:MFS family permease